ncbi:MAG: hypothetical protein SFU85_10300 [Candidatus Methylacidiphilales bacterium]|nr:hypothetical protein [Candidatus Methylacidiphilales bacterium]
MSDPDPSRPSNHPADAHWDNLHRRACGSGEVPLQPPPGFSTRVAALATAERRRRQADPDSITWALRWLLSASAIPALAALLLYNYTLDLPFPSGDVFSGKWPIQESDPLALLDL